MKKAEINVGDYIVSESFGQPSTRVTGLTKKGDFITDEQELADPMGGAFYVVKKENAILIKDIKKYNEEYEVRMKEQERDSLGYDISNYW